HAGVQRMRCNVFDEHRLSGFQCCAQFWVPVELHCEVVQVRIFVCSNDGGHAIARTCEHDGAVRHAECACCATHEQVEEIRNGNVSRHFVQNVNELAPVVGVGLCPGQFRFRSFQCFARASQNGSHAKLCLNACEQFLWPERLAN